MLNTKKFLFSLLFLLILPSFIASAQTPPPSPMFSITGATSVPEHTLVQLTLSGGSANTAWLVTPSVSQYINGQTIVFVAPPGTYQVIAVAVSGSTPIILQTTVTITAAPSKTKYAIGVFDPSTLPALPASQIAIYNSTTLPATALNNGYTWLQYSTGDIIPSKSGASSIMNTKWGSAAASVGLPALVLTDETGTVVNSVPLPQLEAGIVQLMMASK